MSSLRSGRSRLCRNKAQALPGRPFRLQRSARVCKNLQEQSFLEPLLTVGCRPHTLAPTNTCLPCVLFQIGTLGLRGILRPSSCGSFRRCCDKQLSWLHWFCLRFLTCCNSRCLLSHSAVAASLGSGPRHPQRLESGKGLGMVCCRWNLRKSSPDALRSVHGGRFPSLLSPASAARVLPGSGLHLHRHTKGLLASLVV